MSNKTFHLFLRAAIAQFEIIKPFSTLGFPIFNRGLDYIFNLKIKLVCTSNAVSIDTVLGDEPIVVTPSSCEAWHGIAIAYMP